METAAKHGDMTVKEVAEKTGVNRATILRWAEGAEPHPSTLKKVADAYGVTPYWLMTGDVHITGDNNNVQSRVETIDEALAIITQLTESLRLEQQQTAKAQEQVSELIALLKGRI
ncbi:MAG: helix-turn-helix transcriptional regulator [Porphyromonas sp.]|nr:helix-turn-helix transcriptional regulator [Porphyromonas sp.]